MEHGKCKCVWTARHPALVARTDTGSPPPKINNVEKRSGVAALTIFLVLGSVFGATMSYYRAVPMAGYILAPSCAWLSVATVLVCSIWSLNGKEALYPKKA